jgi:hypothetical protein
MIKKKKKKKSNSNSAETGSKEFWQRGFKKIGYT